MSSVPRTAHATDEVELTADELQGMKTVHATVAEVASIPAPSAVESTASSHSAQSAKKTQLPASILYIALSVGVAAAAVTAFVLVAKHAAPESQSPTVATRAFVTTVPQQPDPVVDVVDTATPGAPPVRFTNPFDKSEVFEFPAGTTRAEARDAVADILMQRATERKVTIRTHRRQ